MSNIVLFPEIKRNSMPQTLDEMAEKMAERKSEYVNDIIDFYGAELLRKVAMDGFEIDDDNFMKDFAFTLEGMRSCLYRSVGISHPLQESVDSAISIEDVNFSINEEYDDDED
jgi:hypothetical protein